MAVRLDESFDIVVILERQSAWCACVILMGAGTRWVSSFGISAMDHDR